MASSADIKIEITSAVEGFYCVLNRVLGAPDVQGAIRSFSSPYLSGKRTEVVFRAITACYFEQLDLQQFEWRAADSRHLFRFLNLEPGELAPDYIELATLAEYLKCNLPSTKQLSTSIFKAFKVDQQLQKLSIPKAIPVYSVDRFLAFLNSHDSCSRSSETSTTSQRQSQADDRNRGSNKQRKKSGQLLERAQIIGSFDKGGLVKFVYFDRTVNIELSRALWAVVAILAKAASCADIDCHPPEFSGCVSSLELCRRLRRATAASTKPMYCQENGLAKYIHRLRKQLERSLGVGASDIIETKRLGYRLKTGARWELSVVNDESS